MNNRTDLEEIKQMLLTGVHRIISTSSSGELSPVQADRSFRQDRHLRREILFVLQGNSLFMLNGQVYPATPGTAFLLNKWEVHSNGYRTGDCNLLHLWLYFHNECLYSLLLRVGTAGHYLPTIHPPQPATSEMEPDIDGEYTAAGHYFNLGREAYLFFSRRWDLLEKNRNCSSQTQNLLIKSALNAVLEEFAIRQFDLIQMPETSKTQDIATFLCNHIRNANGRDCSLEKLEKLTGYSRFYLSRHFRTKTGQTIGSFINEVRLQFVTEAIKKGLKQKEIAEELGFSSPASFWFWQSKHKHG